MGSLMNGSGDPWQALTEELSIWSKHGVSAPMWWRDDDAIEHTPALDRMFLLSAKHRVPLGLAVIPAKAKSTLADRLRDEALIEVLHHGFMHNNHEPKGERASEFGRNRPPARSLAEMAEGGQMLSSFQRTVPIFVPPWNRL